MKRVAIAPIESRSTGKPIMTMVRGKQLAVDVDGEGDPLILLHGLGGTTNVWGAQVPALASKYRTIRVDMEGAGRSPARGVLSIDGWVDDLRVLMQERGIAKARIAAHSLGTLIAQHFTALYPDMVRSLVLLGVNRAPEDARRQVVRDRASKVRAEGMEGVAGLVIKGGLSRHTLQTSPLTVAFVRELLLRQSPEGYARCCEAVAAATPAELARINCPVLLVSGAEDTVSPPSVAEGMMSLLADSKLQVLEQCGHWLPLEKPAEVGKALMDFFE